MTSDQILFALWRDLCEPILQAAAARFPEQQAALALTPLVVAQTDPPRAGVFAFAETGVVDCGAYDLPAAGGAALAAFFEAGLNGPLEPSLRPIVQGVLDGQAGQLVASLRPDKGEATCSLVARGDRHPPVPLFLLRSTEHERMH